MIEGDFDRWTLANMNAALDEVCRNTPRGQEHAVRRRIAKQIVKCAMSGRTTLDELTAAGGRALTGLAASRSTGEVQEPATHRQQRAGGA